MVRQVSHAATGVRQVDEDRRTRRRLRQHGQTVAMSLAALALGVLIALAIAGWLERAS